VQSDISLCGEYFPGPGNNFFLLNSSLVEFPIVALGLYFLSNELFSTNSWAPGPGFLLKAWLFLTLVPIEKLGNFVPVKQRL